MSLGSAKTPDFPEPPPPPREVDVDPNEEEVRKRLRKSAAANTLMTSEMLEAPTILSPKL